MMVAKQATAMVRASLVTLVAGALSLCCKSSSDPVDKGLVTVQLDAVPGLVKADSAATSTVWATVTLGGAPVPDSTRVYFAVSMGSISAEAATQDGLARATFTAGKEVGVAAVIAQVKAVRDTVLITLY